MIALDKWGPLTVLAIAIALIVAVGGAVVCIVHPETLSFNQYINDLKVVGSAALGGAGIGRGLALHGDKVAQAHTDATILNATGELTGRSEGVKAEGHDDDDS